MRQYKRASTVLNKAADLLEEEGWVRGAMECRNGKRCAVGAVAAITGDLIPDVEYESEPDAVYRKSEIVQTKELDGSPSPIFEDSISYLAGEFLKKYPDEGLLGNMNPLYLHGYRANGLSTEVAVSIVTRKNDSHATKLTRRTIVSLLRRAAASAKADKN